MHICILSDRYPTHNAQGGASVVASRLATAYEKQSHRVTVITTTQSDADVAEQSASIELLQVDGSSRFRALRGIYSPSAVSGIRSILEDIDPDIVHAHNVHEFLSYHSLKITSEQSIPVVLTFHDAMSVTYGKIKHFVSEAHVPDEEISPSEFQIGPIRRVLQGRTQYVPFRTPINRWYLNRYVNCGVAVSQRLCGALQVNGVDCDRVIHNGVDTARFRDGNLQRFRDRFDLGDSQIILHGGRIGYLKGSTQLAKAVRRLAPTLEDVVLVVTGNENKAFLEEQLAPYEDRLVQTGWLSAEEMIDAHHAATVVVTPSLYLDPFPTMNIEALVSGTPVITSCFGGGPEAVIDGETGIVTNPLDLKRFTADLKGLLTDPGRISRYGENARDHARSTFSIERQAESYLELFENLSDHHT